MQDHTGLRGHRPLVGLCARAFLVWLLIIAAEILHGMARAIFLVPLTGAFRANQIGVFTGSAIILIIASLTIRWIAATRWSELVAVGLFWLVLTVAFEIGLGRFVMGLSWRRIGDDYNLLRGGMMPVGLVILVLSPLIAARLRGGSR
jgi:hypothetical protein